jgi:hypothetical protein
MTTTFAYDDRIGECIVEIFMSGQPNEFGFFVAPNKLLTCAHVIYAGDDPCKIASNSEIRWSGRSLPTQITGIDRGNLPLTLAIVEKNTLVQALMVIEPRY